MFCCFVRKKTIDFITQCDAGKKSNGGNKIQSPSIMHITDYRSAPSALYWLCSALSRLSHPPLTSQISFIKPHISPARPKIRPLRF